LIFPLAGDKLRSARTGPALINMAIPAGTRLSHYEVLAQLGAGGMGEVYLAQDVRLGRRVALKLLPAEFTQDGDRVRRFEQEARAASALNHPNIITIYDIGQVGDLHFIVTEFVDGQTLRQALSARIKLETALEITAQVASALSAAHEAGIVHRDIKPENIMLRRDGYVKVLDFGLAKLTERAATADPEAPTVDRVETDPGTVMGTARYMSPEQARGQKIDARSDIFSLGVVLYEMVTGRAPFEGATMADVFAALLRAEPRPLAESAPEAPAALQRLVGQALHKAQEAWYQTITDLLADLKSLKQELEFATQRERSPVTERGAGQASVEFAKDPGGASAAVSRQTISRGRSRKALDSLAVLPLENASADPNLEYLSDGITESIINSLSPLPKLRVMARSTVFRYKGQAVDAQTVGRELGVRAVMTGRVLQLGDRLVVKAELVDAEDGSQLWGAQYNRQFTDIFAIEEEISREISEKLRLRLSGEQKRRLAKRYTDNTEAYHSMFKFLFG
jgi:serine/threonine protein kinase